MRNEMRINAKDCLDSEPLQSLMQDVSSVGMHWIFRTQDKEDALKGSRSCHLSFSSQWNRQRSCGHGAYRRRYGRLKNPKTIQVELQKASAHFRQITVVRQFGRGGILCCSPDQTCVKELLNCSTFASHQMPERRPRILRRPSSENPLLPLDEEELEPRAARPAPTDPQRPGGPGSIWNL
ncbi:uncharacterized protein [Dermacentor albipictus]|uniref:uncharacterized protein isoform X2 n=1 Tax=Dermacentor albipictus TaxID=60249 RepID=UPI0038FC73A6